MDIPHARLYVGVPPQRINELLTEAATTAAVMRYEYPEWGIDRSRALIEEVYRTDEAGKVRVFAVVVNTMTMEAQNALLKIFEDPPARSAFMLFVPTKAWLLPTLNSRLVEEREQGGGYSHEAFMVAWQQLSLAEQLAEVEVRTKKKDTAWLMEFKQAGLWYLAKQHTSLTPELAVRLYEALSLVGTRGASNKMLLEEVVLLFSSPRKTG